VLDFVGPLARRSETVSATVGRHGSMKQRGRRAGGLERANRQALANRH
jgi:hypothetical protein